MRLDRLLSEMNIATRKEIKEMARKGRIMVNGAPVRDSGTQVSETDEITVDGQPVRYAAFEYYMMNKPAGVITATEDPHQSTVLDLMRKTPPMGGALGEVSDTSQPIRRDVAPVGRLDKDTTGLLLLTNDGALAHRLLAPGKHVDKVYEAVVRQPVTDDDIRAFAEGLLVDEDWRALPAKLEVIEQPLERETGHCPMIATPDGANPLSEKRDSDLSPGSRVRITIHEGKFHQIKRMFAAIGNEVLALKRLSMGPLALDPELAEGAWRPLRPKEIELLRQK